MIQRVADPIPAAWPSAPQRRPSRRARVAWAALVLCGAIIGGLTLERIVTGAAEGGFGERPRPIVVQQNALLRGSHAFASLAVGGGSVPLVA
ncbi:MAG: hypothetical protein AAGA20_23125, partial [Planctomycetota bacterium]